MKKCIICRKEKNKSDFSDEHVIPDAIGGVYHIFTVCKTCNSKLGSKVDSKLTNHLFTKFMRYDLGISGKEGEIPNPFDGTHILDNDSDTKIRLDITEDRILKPYLLQKTNKIYDENNNLKINIQVDSKDKNNIDVILNKILTREKINAPKNILENIETTTKSFHPVIKMQKKVDIKEFKIALLKIAYEFAVDTIDEYFYDNEAIEISELLFNPNYEVIDKYFAGNGFEKDMLKEFEVIINFEKKRHILILACVPEVGLVCFISLYNLFTIAVRLSENINLNGNIYFGINDLENKHFEKLNIFELAKKNYSPEIRTFQYYFDNKIDYNTFLELQSSEKFQHYMNESNFPLYNENFRIKYNDINHLLEEYINKGDIEYLGDGINHKNLIKIKENLYRKILPINKFFQIIAIEIEQKLEKF